MKKFALEQLPPEICELFESAQQERVLVTRNGQPYALVASVGNKDEEDLQLEESPEFWQMIQQRRRETATVTLEEVMAELQAQQNSGQEKAGKAAP